MMTEVEIQQQQEDLHETKQDFELVDLSEQDDYGDMSLALKGKDAKIRELQTNLDRARFVINFYKEENKQLKTKHFIDEVKFIKAQREAKKAKVLLDEVYGEYDDEF